MLQILVLYMVDNAPWILKRQFGNQSLRDYEGFGRNSDQRAGLRIPLNLQGFF
ncbi:hypothetical protein JXJ21_03835 [candidate division KSB1 bacterium]|nr:hypothetical protein [candidate division KSB1 bacterium]